VGLRWASLSSVLLDAELLSLLLLLLLLLELLQLLASRSLQDQPFGAGCAAGRRPLPFARGAELGRAERGGAAVAGVGGFRGRAVAGPWAGASNLPQGLFKPFTGGTAGA